MAAIRVLGVHGVGDHHSDLTWQSDWRQAIGAGLAAAHSAAEVEIDFVDYDQLFAAQELTFWGTLEAVAKLLGSAAGAVVHRRRGLVDRWSDALRWTAGMVVQWVENDDLRRQTRQRLADKIDEFKPQVVCGHSLGSLICYDTFTHSSTAGRAAGRTFVSLGSQIGNPFVVGSFLAGRIKPIEDCQWRHLYNVHDNAFTSPIRLTSPSFRQIDTSFDIEGLLDHSAVEYFNHPATRARVWPEVAVPKSRVVVGGKTWQRDETRQIERRRQAVKKKEQPRESRRRALLVGINDYPSVADRLEGCVNDAFLVSAVLQECQFQADDIRVVLDHRATADGIRERLTWLVQDALPGDELVFYYSGHGAQLPSYNAAEVVDHMDEALVPYDFDWSSERAIIDEWLYELYSQLDYDVRLVMILDCCHSGGMDRGPGPRIRGLNPPDDIRHRALRWEPRRQMWVPRDWQPARKGLRVSAREQVQYVGTSGTTRRLGRGLAVRTLDDKHYNTVRRARDHLGPYLPVIIQACQEGQYSYEYRHGVQSHGAFTYAMSVVLRRGKTISFQQLVQRTGKVLEELEYDQTPAILGPRKIVRSSVPWHR